LNKKVLVLHQSDELKLIALQKDLSLLLCNCPGVFKKYPLWAEVPECISVKNISGIHTENIFTEKEGVFISVKINFQDGNEIKSHFQLFVFTENSAKPENAEKIEKDFVLECKIFRIAEGCFEGNRFWLTDSLWKKITN